MESDSERRGYLLKQGAVVKSWRRRLFVLTDAGISYYLVHASQMGLTVRAINLEKGVSRRGHIPAESIQRIMLDQDITSVAWPSVAVSGGSCFAIVATSRTYYLVARSAQQAREWCNAIVARVGICSPYANVAFPSISTSGGNIAVASLDHTSSPESPPGDTDQGSATGTVSTTTVTAAEPAESYEPSL